MGNELEKLFFAPELLDKGAKPVDVEQDFDPPLSKGLVGRWLFNEGAGNTVFDISGKGNHGTIIGASFTPDGLDFEASSSNYINFGNPTNLQITGDMTVICKIKFESLGVAQAILAKANTGDSEAANFLYLVGLDASNDLRWFWEHGAGVNVDITVTPSSALSTGTKYILGYVRYNSGTAARFFIDGIQEGSSTTGLTAATGGTTGIVTIGRNGSNSSGYVDGETNSIIFLNRALSNAEMWQWSNDLCQDLKPRSIWLPAGVAAAPPAGGPPTGSLSLMGVGI